MTFQELIMALQNYWADHGCIIQQPYDTEKGAGTFHPATFLRALGPEPWRVAYVEPPERMALVPRLLAELFTQYEQARAGLHQLGDGGLTEIEFRPRLARERQDDVGRLVREQGEERAAIESLEWEWLEASEILEQADHGTG